MIGTVDKNGHALLRIRLKHPSTETQTELDAWVDTAFTGELVLSEKLIGSLGLPVGPAVTAGLADGREVQLDTHTCLLECFGHWKSVEVIVNQGLFPLLGVTLLLTHKLTVDYSGRILSLD